MRIGDLARSRGVRASTIRYYESLGLLAPAARVSGRRDYGQDAVGSLRLIQALQQAGFTLAQIRNFRAHARSQQAQSTWREEARAKLRELDAAIGRLQSARGALASSLDCDCDGRAEGCRLVDTMERRAR